MQTDNDWLISKLASDLGVTNNAIELDVNATKQIQRYIVAEIDTYEELVQILHGKVGK
jgi:hypothetical protein